MPKKFQGENTKAAEAKARKGAALAAAEEMKSKAKEDEFWTDDDKNVQRKFQRKDEKLKKKMETVERKVQNRLLHDDEINAIASSEKLPTVAAKITRAKIGSSLENQKQPNSGSKPIKKSEEEPLPENVNRLVMDGLDARGLDEAIAVLSVKPVALDRHPERRLKAAYDQFEQTTLPTLKAENPNMRLSQLKQILKKDWMKSPDNPLNQRHAAYNDKST